MSWIIRDLWSTLESRQNQYAALLATNKVRAFEVINGIAYEVGQRHRVLLQLNFPPGQKGLSLNTLGHRDLSLIIHHGREKFGGVSEAEVKKIFLPLEPRSFEPINRDQQGFKVQLSNGRIDCLPGAVHLWCEITPEILDVLDTLFRNVYELEPS